MATSNEKILDAYIRRQTYILRYAGGLRNQLAKLVLDSGEEVSDIVLLYLTKLEGSRTLTSKRERELLRKMESKVREVRLAAWRELYKEVESQIKEFAVAEAAAGAATIEAAVPVVLGATLPPAEQLYSVIRSQPFEGRTLKGWVERTAAADVERITRQAKIGIVQGVPPKETARNIRGTRKGKRYSPIERKMVRDLEAVLLTVTNGIQQEAKQKLYEANSDIIDRELYVATLDARTTIECASNDGKVYERGRGPIPPLHFRCRSLRVPLINDDMLGDRPFNPTTEKQLLREYGEQANIARAVDRNSLPYGHKSKFDAFARKRRRELIGRVPARTSYSEWLKRQSTEFQDEVLGPTRAKLFRKGGLSLDKFVARDGSLLTLDELKSKGIDVPS